MKVATQYWLNSGVQYWTDGSKFHGWSNIGVQRLPDVDNQYWSNVNPRFIHTWDTRLAKQIATSQLIS